MTLVRGVLCGDAKPPVTNECSSAPNIGTGAPVGWFICLRMSLDSINPLIPATRENMPQTANQPANSDDSNHVEPAKSWLEQRIEGTRKIVRASGLLGASLVLGSALGLFSNQNDWIMIWMVFGGWMACWGVITMVAGIGSLMESRFMRSQLVEQDQTRQFRPVGASQI
ncbi:MAG: hypothetical protein M3539_12490, partial [Acidobacteriota bacterium]|nr:hypothetical protein [Acidobacteriota bacterium]